MESATLPVATFSKFQPLSKDFLDLSNPKAVLEMRLRHFACLSKGDIVAINYNKKIYELNVLETKVSTKPKLVGDNFSHQSVSAGQCRLHHRV